MSGYCPDCGNVSCICDDEPVVQMKCPACGYERLIAEDTPFIESGLVAYYNTPFKINRPLISKKVLICPLCGSLKVEL